MATLDETPITATQISDYLQTADDFEFELDVFRLCLTHDSKAQHGGTYSDPTTEKDRQFDIRMELRYAGRCLKLAVECKKLKSYFPLIVSCVPRRWEEAFHEAFICGGRSFYSHRYKIQNQIYRRRDHVGKATTQVGVRKERNPRTEVAYEANDKEAYDKWTQAIQSAYDLLIQSMPVTHKDVMELANPVGVVVLPVLVVPDGTLWEVRYADDGVQQGPPHTVDSSTLFLDKAYSCQRGAWAGTYTISHLNLYTRSGFQKFLEKDREDLFEYLFPGEFPPT
jgi:hypothetical protein